VSITLNKGIEGDDVDLLKPGEFYKFVREERLFCAVLAHLVMQKGDNLRRFIDLVYSKLGRAPFPPNASLEAAEFYLEFSYLRDYWFSLGKDNHAKRDLIFELFTRVPALDHLSPSDFPVEISDFNEIFMGPRGKQIRRDIVSPGRWDVQSLHGHFKESAEVFHALCSFKWAFNIKPDLVILIPEHRTICIEAKLESGVDRYPSTGAEKALFDSTFGREQRRVDQVELQKFLFDTLLQNPSDAVLVGRKEPRSGFHDAFLSWREVFDRLDTSSAHIFVQKLIAENTRI